MRLVTVVATLLLVLGSSLAQEQDDATVPEDVLENFRYFAGTWEVKGRVGDVRHEGGWTGRWGKGRNCLMRESWYSENGQTKRASGIIGWDPAKKRIAEYAFWTPNDCVAIMWTLLPSGNLEGELKGTEDGIEVTATAKVTKKGPREFIYESKNAAGDEVEVVFHKVPGKKQKKSGD